MSNQAQRSIVIVNTEAMMNDQLFRSMKFAAKSKVEAMVSSVNSMVEERIAFEMTVERKGSDGRIYSGVCPDALALRSLKNHDAVACMLVALKVDPRAYLYPQSQDGGKQSDQTSNLKSMKKAREIAETIWSPVVASPLEKVVKVWTVCAHYCATHGRDVLPRNESELFLNASRIRSGSSEIFDAIDAYRAKEMSTGAATQTSQMVRQLVALKSATDVREGRAKHTRINPEGLVISALMRRFGILTDVTEADASEPQPEPIAVDALTFADVDATDWIDTLD
jgi:hypothetical protein